MTGERLPSPDWQVRMALEVLRGEGIPFLVAWALAVRGEICDSYRSARGTAEKDATSDAHPVPPNLRTSEGQKRCAGCRFVADAASGGRARCTLYGADVFPGVLWPHRTDDRQQWQKAIATAVREWRRSYEGEPSSVAAVLDAIKLRGAESASAGARESRGHVAA